MTQVRSRGRGRSGRRRGTVPHARRASLSAARLASAESSLCPHCGRTSKTVQGVCADCWGSKGGRQYWLRKYGPRPSVAEDVLGFDPLHPALLACYAIATLVVAGLVLWISG